MLIDGSEEIFTATTDRIVEFAERMRELAAVHIDQSNGLAIACKGDRRGDTRMAARSDRDYFLHVGKQRELVLAQQNIIRLHWKMEGGELELNCHLAMSLSYNCFSTQNFDHPLNKTEERSEGKEGGRN